MENESNTPDQAATAEGNGDQTPITFDSWLSGQDEQTVGLINGRMSTLKATLQKERDARSSLEKEIKTLRKGADESTQLALDELQKNFDLTTAQLNFYQDLEGSGVTNMRSAWALAQEYGAIGRDGRVNLETLKTQAPELFKQAEEPKPPSNAGNRSPDGKPSGQTMDAWIRDRAFRNRR